MPRARDRLRRAARAAGRVPGRALRRGLRRARRDDRARRAASSRPRSRRCCGSASARSATWARRSPTARSPACPRSPAPGATRAAAARTSRPPPPAAIDADKLRPRRPAPRAGAPHQHVPARARADRPGARRRRSRRWCAGTPTRRRSRPTRTASSKASRREDLFTVVLEQFMTDTARYADVVLPATTQLEHLDAVFSWGHHYVTYNEPAIAPRGQAKPNTEIFRLLAARHGPRRSVLPRERRGDAGEPVRRRARPASRSPSCAERGWVKIDLGQAPAPARRGRLRHARRQARAARRRARRARHRPAAVLRPAGRGRRPRARAALPARAHHAEDAPLPELHVRQPAPPARRPARAVRRHPPRRRRPRGIEDGAPRPRLERPRRPSRPARASPTTRGRRCSSRRWAGGTATIRGGARRAGHDLPGADHARPRADLQRQPRPGGGHDGLSQTCGSSSSSGKHCRRPRVIPSKHGGQAASRCRALRLHARPLRAPGLLSCRLVAESGPPLDVGGVDHVPVALDVAVLGADDEQIRSSVSLALDSLRGVVDFDV